MKPEPAIWGQVLNSVAFDLVNPRVDDVDFRTVAIALARIPRFLGHTEGAEILSVAQHCVEGAKAIERDGHGTQAAAAFLLHDAHEAYIGDIASPVQKAIGQYLFDARGYEVDELRFRDAIYEMKSRIDSAIYQAAGIEWPLPDAVAAVVKEYDVRMCMTEAKARLAPAPRRWSEPYASAKLVEGLNLDSWSQGWARTAWFDAFSRLTINRR